MKWLIFFHVLGATIWVGGHLIVCFRHLPAALKEKNPKIITDFEQKFEPLGLPALLVQVITGVWMAVLYNVKWFSFQSATETVVTLKLLLLFITIGLAIHARLFLIPKLKKETLGLLAAHIIAVTLIAVTMVYLGISVRFGGI